MKDFILKHPFITAGIIFGICDSVVRVASCFKRKTQIIVLAEGTLPDEVTEEKDESDKTQEA